MGERERENTCKLHVLVHVHVCFVVVASNLHLITQVMFTLYMPGISPGSMTKTVPLGAGRHEHSYTFSNYDQTVCIIYTDIIVFYGSL